MRTNGKALGAALTGIALVAVLAVGFFGERPGTGPRAEVENPEVDFGTADVNADVQCAFRIRNAGGADLLLTDIHADCACSNTRMDKRRIRSGDSAYVKVTLHTPGRSGPVEGRMIVQTNDPDHAILPLRIVGRVRPTLQVVPSTIYFCFIDKPRWQDERVRHAMVYAWSEEQQPSLDKVRPSADWLTASFEPQAGGHRILGRVKVRIKKLPPKDDGQAKVAIVARAGRETIKRTLTVLVDPP